MVKFKGRLKFRQYIQNKPVKFGIKCFLLCNSITGYCYDIIVYTGKNTVKKRQGFNMTETIVLEMIEPYLNSYRVLYVDNFYNTIKLSNTLLTAKTGLVGTLRKNRTHSTEKIKFPKRDQIKICMNTYNNLCMIHCTDRNKFIVTTNTSFPETTQTNKNDKVKSSLTTIQEYTRYSKGVDLCNQQTTLFRYNHASRKWWKPLFFHLIYLLIHNSFLLFRKYRKDLKYKDFYMEIIMHLLGDAKQKPNPKNRFFHTFNYIDIKKKSNIRRNCKLCKKKTIWKCYQCSKINEEICLCIPDCYNEYHTNFS